LDGPPRLFSLTLPVEKDAPSSLSNQTAIVLAGVGPIRLLKALLKTRTLGVFASRPTACTHPPPFNALIVLFRISNAEFIVEPFPLLIETP
jgi:hypothetical protein